MTASATIKNPPTFNRYSYVLNSPYKFVDPLGLLSQSTGACGGWCNNSDSSLNGGGAFDSIASGGFGGGEIITLTLNIIYDVTYYTAAQAAVVLADTIQDLKDVMGKLNIEIQQIYTPGKASKGDAASGCNGCVYKIDEGTKKGAINVFLSNNNNARNIGNDSRYLERYQQISIEQWGKSEIDSHTLAHEVGHLFRHLAGAWKGPTGKKVPLDFLSNITADSSNISEDQIIDRTNSALRTGNVEYGVDWGDNAKGRIVNYGGGRGVTLALSPAENNIYRDGAERLQRLAQMIPREGSRRGVQ